MELTAMKKQKEEEEKGSDVDWKLIKDVIKWWVHYFCILISDTVSHADGLKIDWWLSNDTQQSIQSTLQGGTIRGQVN
jgi:hypothetical protein